MDRSPTITESKEYGTALALGSVEFADEFEDFLTEKCFVLFTTKTEPEVVTFYFGQASAPSKVQELFSRFEQERAAT